jgi:hypothetical protein
MGSFPIIKNKKEQNLFEIIGILPKRRNPQKISIEKKPSKKLAYAAYCSGQGNL